MCTSCVFQRMSDWLNEEFWTYTPLCVLTDDSCLCQCGVLKEKLDSLLKTLNEESQASTMLHQAPPPTIAEEQEEVEGVVLPPPSLQHHHHHPHTSCSPRTNTSSSSSAAAAIFKPREQLMLRANSLKKAIRQIIEHTEKGRTSRWTGRVRETGQTDRYPQYSVFLCFYK